jgi:hypothetical protein
MTSGLDAARLAGVAQEKGALMSEMLHASVQPAAGAPSVRALAAKAGVTSAVAGAALAFYSAYGDPHVQASQKAGVPFLVGAVVAVSAIAFGLLVPRALRAIQEGRSSAPRWGLAHSIVALVLTPFAFWSGVPLVLGAAGLLLGAAGRKHGRGRGASTAAAVIGVLVVVGGIIFAVLGNTVLARN